MVYVLNCSFLGGEEDDVIDYFSKRFDCKTCRIRVIGIEIVFHINCVDIWITSGNSAGVYDISCDLISNEAELLQIRDFLINFLESTNFPFRLETETFGPQSNDHQETDYRSKDYDKFNF